MPDSVSSTGRIQRGVADRIEAALWFSDLRSFTTITDTAKPTEIHPAPQRLMPRRSSRPSHEAGGDVLKLIAMARWPCSAPMIRQRPAGARLNGRRDRARRACRS